VISEQLSEADEDQYPKAERGGDDPRQPPQWTIEVRDGSRLGRLIHHGSQA
jgi:hypothetical protein